MNDWDSLVADIAALPGALDVQVEKSMQQTAMETKKVWQPAAKRGTRGGVYAPSIDYTVDATGSLLNVLGLSSAGGSLTAEVGPNLSRYGGTGLVPSWGIFDDPTNVPAHSSPSRARQVAFTFAQSELPRRMAIALDESLKARNL